ncbi:LOW QUALITY PROTEIN: hypothetical protein HZS_285 [Henneguya salminicola]|nr:LOW QUALITY PROTEIN: hypothetical protein HZS_285 [Henneguya salminicola]
MHSCHIPSKIHKNKFLLISGRSSIYIHKISYDNTLTDIDELANSLKYKLIKSISAVFHQADHLHHNFVDLRAKVFDFINISKQHIFIVIGFSDGIIRVFSIFINNYNLKFIKQFAHSKGMPTSIKYLNHDGQFAASFTDGTNIYTIWTLDSSIACFYPNIQSTDRIYFYRFR